jgi:hypothetical protein
MIQRSMASSSQTDFLPTLRGVGNLPYLISR